MLKTDLLGVGIIQTCLFLVSLMRLALGAPQDSVTLTLPVGPHTARLQWRTFGEMGELARAAGSTSSCSLMPPWPEPPVEPSSTRMKCVWLESSCARICPAASAPCFATSSS